VPVLFASDGSIKQNRIVSMKLEDVSDAAKKKNPMVQVFPLFHPTDSPQKITKIGNLSRGYSLYKFTHDNEPKAKPSKKKKSRKTD
jgi:hypothetical protein